MCINFNYYLLFILHAFTCTVAYFIFIQKKNQKKKKKKMCTCVRTYVRDVNFFYMEFQKF